MSFAAAKVNLYLHVTGRRRDGYHELDSLVAFAGVGDELSAEPADSLSLTIDGPFAGALSTGEDNLVLRAARALAQAAGIEPRARLHLTKRLPVASGIGGGSADAAATFRALASMWGISEVPEAVALSVGADVPVCLYGKPALMSGIGEVIAPAPPLPPAWLVLVNPGVALTTAAVFRERAPGFMKRSPEFEAPASFTALVDALKDRRNDLQPPALRLAPVIGEVLAALSTAPGCALARMSGSGATCFGLFEEEGAAVAAVRSLAQPGWWSVATPLLP